MYDCGREDAADGLHFEVEAGEAGRLDVVVVARLESISRSRVRRWIDAGQVRVDGQVVRAGRKVVEGQRIDVRILPAQPLELVAEPIPIEVIYEDDAIIVVNKPAGLVVHPGAGNPSQTLANGLVYHFQRLSRTEGLRPGIVHRLDRDTSGVMVVAKNEVAHQRLADQFQRRQVEKQYRALLYGPMEESRGTIDRPIGRDRRDRVKVSARSNRLREARTGYRVLRRFAEFSEVAAFPRTGRTHQIRVHFQLMNHPVVGDALYDGGRLEGVRDKRVAAAVRKLDRHFLHAQRLAFAHPQTGERVDFATPLPKELEALLVTLGE